MTAEHKGCEIAIPHAHVLPPLEPHPERLDIHDPRFSPELIWRHENRYRWARDVIQNRFVRAGRVIDFACGTGYGSAILHEVAHEVYGRDKSEEAVEIANARHSSTLVNFKAKGIAWHGVEFDAVVSIETIEHLTESEVDAFLTACQSLVMPNGLLIISTPRAREDRVVDNPYHLREYTQEELEAIVARHGFVDIRFDTWLLGFLCMVARRPA